LPFDGPALKRIHELTRGVPRRINLLCGRALLGAWAKGTQQADRAMVERAAKEVFDIEAINKTATKHRRTRMAMGLLVLILMGIVGALAVWPNLPKAQPTRAANAPAH
jgi:general secretion pathway protein A